MATNFEEILKCAVCLGIFEEPKVLTCKNGTHVFCKTCLVPLVKPDKTITCPQCRQKHQVPNGEVENLSTDLKSKEMIENCVCADCRIFDKFCKPCGKCGVRSCHVCICGHDDGEKCELLGTIRNLSGKLPNQSQREAMDDLKGKWEIFRKKNSEQREETDRRMTKLIESLQQKKNDMLKVFDNYDKYAKERIDLICQSKQIKNTTLQEIIKNVNDMNKDAVKRATKAVTGHEKTISKKDAVLAEVVPDALGTVWSDCVEREINNFGRQITRREPGKDTDEDLVFSTEGSVCDCPNNHWPSTILARGQIQIYRSYGGRYQLQVVDKNDASKILKSFAWNNQSQDAQTKTVSWVWCHVPWMLKTGDRTVGYSMEIVDDDRRCEFDNVMTHALLIDTA